MSYHLWSGLLRPFFGSLYRLRRGVLLRRYLARGPIFTGRTGDRPAETTLDLVTVAFNNPVVIQHQIRLLRKYLRDPFIYSVADNSSSDDARGAIRAICEERGVPYLSLPPNPFVGSDSHGAALTWIYRNYIRPRASTFFGFIDHDIFPIKTTSVLDHLRGREVYGHLQQRQEKWYLWPGFAFFEHERVPADLSLMPSPGLDTGGAAWRPLYSHLDKKKLSPVPRRLERLRNDVAIRNPQSDNVELLGDWLHLYNASRWLEVAHRDLVMDEELLDSL